MTLIIAFKHKDSVILAGDKMGSDGFTKDINKKPKIFKLTGEDTTVYVGYTSSFRFGQLLEYMAIPRKAPNIDEYEYMVKHFIPEMRNKLEQGKYTGTDNKGESGQCIVVLNNRIFKVQSDFSVLENANEYCSIGSGEYHAAGILSVRGLRCYDIEEFCNILFTKVAELVTTVSSKYDLIYNSKTE